MYFLFVFFSRTQAQSELIYHGILHSVPNIEKSTKISCPFCSKFFQKLSLRTHLRQHTNEKEFQCKICNMGFVRKSNLNAHLKTIHVKKTDKKDVDESKINMVECKFCDKKFQSK